MVDRAVEQDESRHPPQFSLRRLFATTAAVAGVFGAAHWFGPSIAPAIVVIGLFSAAAYRVPRQQADKWTGAVTTAVFCLGLLALIPPAFQRPSAGNTRRSACLYKLKQIGLGLQLYLDVHRSFPPAYVADENGRPMHSWRVLLLPYLEEQALFEKYDFNEPWDGPHNRLLASQMPEVYRCDADPTPGPTSATSYVAVTGPETAWHGTGSTAKSEINDSTANTIAVVEVANSGINWMEPRDLPYSSLKYGVNAASRFGVSSYHSGGAWSVFLDGHTSWLWDAMPPEMLEALATLPRGEDVNGDY